MDTLDRIMNAALSLVLAGALGLMPGAPSVALAQNAPKQQAVELMMLSGANRVLERIPGLFLDELDKRRGNMPQDVHERLKKMMAQAFDASRLNAQFVEALRKGMDERSLKSGLDWQKSPLASRLTRLDAEATTAEGRKQMEKWAKSLGSVPPARERMELMVRLVRATNGAAVAAEVEVIVKEPIIQTANAALPEQEQKPQEQIQASLVKLREDLVQRKAQELVARMLFAYRDVNNADLQRYADFLESQAGLQYTDRMNAALIGALRESNDSIATRFRELF